MFNLTKSQLSEKANELGFIRDTLEKALRLVDVLLYLNRNKITKDTLALKGGTALNLIIFDLPRLSVDIDLDFHKNHSLKEMLSIRESITSDLITHMTTQGYTLKQGRRSSHSLDPLVFSYLNTGGVNDNIKIEINYSLRSHIFSPIRKSITHKIHEIADDILCLDTIEIFAAKINALISRAAPRDLYDVYNLIRYNVISGTGLAVLRKATIFYTAISQPQIPSNFELNQIDTISQRDIRTELVPVTQKTEKIDLDLMKASVKTFLKDLFQLLENERTFLDAFARKSYHPEYLFDNKAIVDRVQNHPVALWKCRQTND